MKSRARRTLLVVAGVCMLGLVLAPMMAVAAEFSYDKGPSFTVTYPDSWAQDSENPNKVLWRTKEGGALPVMEIQCMDAPAGVTVEGLGNWQKERIAKIYETEVTVDSDTVATLKDGTKCNEVLLTWMFQGWLALQTAGVTTIKDGKVVYITVSKAPGDPDWSAGRSLTFK